MANKTTAQLKAYKDANITSNRINSNTGANHNTFLENLLDSIANRTTDATLFGLFNYDTGRNYIVGQGVIYSNELYICITNTTGAWTPGHWYLATLNIRRGIESIVKGGTTIAFTANLGSAGTDYSLTFNCYTADGNQKACKVPTAERTAVGFKAYPASNCFIDYIAVLI